MKIGFIYKGKSIETGKIIQGQLIESGGNVNAGQTFICPEVSSVSYAGLYRGEGCLQVGPFISVDPATVEIAANELE